MGIVLIVTGYQVDQKEQRGLKFKNTFLFLKIINFTKIPKMFIYIIIGSNCDLSLSNVQLRNISTLMRPTITVIS